MNSYSSWLVFTEFKFRGKPVCKLVQVPPLVLKKLWTSMAQCGDTGTSSQGSNDSTANNFGKDLQIGLLRDCGGFAMELRWPWSWDSFVTRGTSGWVAAGLL